MNKYQAKKDQIINETIEWQLNYANEDWTDKEVAEKQRYFFTMAKRYGLIREFQENGII